MVRFATISDLDGINKIRTQLFGLHSENRPDFFKKDFGKEFYNFPDNKINDIDYGIIVSESNSEIVGMLTYRVIDLEETDYHRARSFIKVEEIAVDRDHLREGIGLEMMNFLRVEAKKIGISKVELVVWEFNEDAQAFYEALGFKTSRSIMEMDFGDEDIRPHTSYVEGKYPILDYDPIGAPVVNPEIFLKGQEYIYDKLIITFFPEVIKNLREEGKISLYDVISGENSVEVYKFADSDVLITLGYVGSPACAGNLHCFYALGIRKVMFCGGGGVLDKNIPVGTPLVVTGAIRDEGLSYQYIPAGRIVYSDEKIVEKICNYMDNKSIPYIKGLTWTTDAMMRETPERVKRRKAEGAKIVEMEQAGCLAIAKYRNFDYGAIIYGGDDVSGEAWDDRKWSSRKGVRYSLVQLCKEIIESF